MFYEMLAGAGWLAAAILFMVLMFTVGTSSAEKRITERCAAYGAFVIEKQKYECKKAVQ